MTYQFAELAQAVGADGQVSPEELLALRRLGWGDGSIHAHEAEAIFALNRQLNQAGPEWTDFFVEALGEFIVNGTPPRGYVDDAEADWLIAAIDHDGRLESMAELELLVRVMERAINVPDRLKHYALRQCEAAVLTGTGPTRCGGELSDSHITPAECRLIRRIIFSTGGHGPAAVTRHDAEMLFRIKDATLGHANAPEWKQLFVDGVGNYLKGFTLAAAQLSHSRARELESFMADNSASVGRFMGAMARSVPGAMNHFGKVFGRKGTGRDFGGLAAEGALVTESEMQWLDAMIEANGEIDELDQAVLDFLAKDAAVRV